MGAGHKQAGERGSKGNEPAKLAGRLAKREATKGFKGGVVDVVLRNYLATQ